MNIKHKIIKTSLSAILISSGLSNASILAFDFETDPASAGVTNPGGSGFFWTGNPPGTIQTSLPTNGPSGLAGDDYIYLADNNNATVSTDRFLIMLDPLDSSATFSYDFHDNHNNSNTGLANFVDVAITDGTTILVADVHLENGLANNWQAVDGTFSTLTDWRVFSGDRAAYLLGGGGFSITASQNNVVATQAQIDSVIDSTFEFYFGTEQISGGTFGDDSVNSETIAVDNFTVVPEPSSTLLVALGFVGLMFRRNITRS